MHEEHTVPETFIEALAKENWLLSQMLEPLDGSACEGRLKELYIVAYEKGRDEEAANFFKWLCKFGVTALYAARAGVCLHSVCPINGTMVKTLTACLEAVAAGTGMAVADDEEAKGFMRFLVGVHGKHHGIKDTMRSVIAAGIRKATGKDASQARLVALLSVNPPEEIHKILMNALTRNSEEFRRGIEIATLLEGCPDSTYEFVKNEIERLKEVEAMISGVHSDITAVVLSGKDIKVSYDPQRAMLVASGNCHRKCNEPEARAIQTNLMTILCRWRDKIMPGRTIAVSLDVRVDSYNDREWYRISNDSVTRLGNHIK